MRGRPLVRGCEAFCVECDGQVEVDKSVEIILLDVANTTLRKFSDVV